MVVVDPPALQAAKHQVETEEKRLLYVGLTRARDQLILTASETPKPERSCAFNLPEELEWREIKVTNAWGAECFSCRTNAKQPVTLLFIKSELK